MAALAEDAYPCCLISPPGSGAASVLAPPVKLIAYPRLRIPLFVGQDRKFLVDELAKFKPTVLHCFCHTKLKLTQFLSQRFDIPYVLTFNYFHPKLFGPAISKKHCAAMIGSSANIAERLGRTYPRLADRLRRINPGTFVEQDCACFSNPDRLTSMVIACRLNSALEFEPLLNAIKHLRIDGYEFMLAIIGSGPAERRIHKLTKALGLSQVVTLVGEICPLRSALTGADIFIRTHTQNRISYALLEAMSVGTAIATCPGGLDDMVIEDRTAVFFDPADELSVYACLQKLLSKREFARQIAHAGQDYLREHHSVSGMVETLLKTYRNAQQWYKEPEP